MTTVIEKAAPKSKTLPHVRAAMPEDFESIMSLCRDLYAENGAVGVNWDVVHEMIITGVNQQRSVIGVIGEPGKITGMIFLRFSTIWYSDELILEELFNFVPKTNRRSRNAHALIEFAKTCAEKIGVPLLIGIVSNQQTESKIKLYSRLLGAQAGAFFLYGTKTGEK